MNLSATSKSVVEAKEAVPWTVKFLATTKSLPIFASCVIVTSLGKPIVKATFPPIAWAEVSETSISFVVPANVAVALPWTAVLAVEP